MPSPGINGEGELRGQPANQGSPGKLAVKTECMCAFSMHNGTKAPPLCRNELPATLSVFA